MMEAISTSDTSVSFYDTVRRNIPEDSNFHPRRRENLIRKAEGTRDRIARNIGALCKVIFLLHLRIGLCISSLEDVFFCCELCIGETGFVVRSG
jgi:hypothetical protein